MTFSVEIRDPQAKGNVTYKVPLNQMLPTAGLREYLTSSDQEAARHRSLCLLYNMGKCLQGETCKSFHVEKSFLEAERRRMGVECDGSYLREVMVRTMSGVVFVVRYNAVEKTKGLEAYRKQAGKGGVLHGLVCPYESCTMGRGCHYIHLKEGEMREYAEGRQRTPCCIDHGDVFTAACERVPLSLSLVEDGRMTYALTNRQLAPTAGLTRIKGTSITNADLCGMHVKSRCKFGRSCTKVHVCREWAEQHQVKVALPERVERSQSVTPISVSPPESTVSPSPAPSSPTDSLPPLLWDDDDAFPHLDSGLPELVTTVVEKRVTFLLPPTTVQLTSPTL